MALKCGIRQSGDVTILDLNGVLSIREPATSVARGSVVLGDKVRELLESGNKKILLNLASLSSMDSAGVGELIATMTSVRSRGGGLKLITPPRDVRKLLELTQLSKVIDIRDNEESAVQAFATGIPPAA